MKEAFQHIDNDIIFREIFRDEQTVRRNHGVPTDVDFSNGVGTFNGTSSLIEYRNTGYLNLRSNFSIRVKFNYANNGVVQTVLSKGVGNTTQYCIDITTTNRFRFFGYEATVAKGNTTGVNVTEGEHEAICTFDGTNWIIYLDKVATSTADAAVLTDTAEAFFVGDRNAVYYEGDIDLIEFYNRALTAEEVANL